ncbi:MAG: type II secretion system protein [Acidobacteriota bacterium]|nr:type II secretion system protein [Acidobacteriota bacterium]MDQ7087838.1 type II secretion system protein [Acidobacteriota bacterium]
MICDGHRAASRSKTASGKSAGPRERGFTLLELLMVTGIIGVLSAIAIPLLQRAIVQSELKAVVSEGRTIHTAFKNYYLDRSQYPSTAGADAFELDTFEPLRRNRYYVGNLGARLLGEQADAYGSPDDQGQNQEFWLEMTLSKDQSIRFLICDSDNAPLSGGTYLDGVFAYENGVQKNL